MVGQKTGADVGYFLVRDYSERTRPGALPDADLLAELHDLVDEVPELSVLVRSEIAPSGDALRRQLDLARRRTSEMWVEFGQRFGVPPQPVITG